MVACSEMYFQGVSTRNVRAVLEVMCGFEVSAMTVSRVAMTDDNLWRPTRRAVELYTKDKLSTRRGPVHSIEPMQAKVLLARPGFR